MKRPALAAFVVGLMMLPDAAQAAPALDGATMPWFWALPFAGLLLSIATGPLLFAAIWHAHYGKIAAGWALLALAPIALSQGVPAALAGAVHAVLAEYLSFIVVLFALYTVAGGILVTGRLRGSPVVLTALLAAGAAMASIVGTTGAAMILIRPVMRALEGRQNRAHVIVFFIILVANVGGALTPLGDPPLFVGFLRGVDFFWTAGHLWLPTLTVALVVLAGFLALDSWLYRGEHRQAGAADAEPAPLRLQGGINIALIGLVIAGILASAAWRPGVAFEVYGTIVELQNLLRDAVLVATALLSLWLTPDEHRAANGFTWEPIREVAKLFAGIFVAIVPVLAMLQAGRDGPFAWLLDLVTRNDGRPHDIAYFWMTGVLSAFLDNAPTYLVFFQLAGGDPQTLMGPLAGTLAAISMGAVYMGALTYIGNAPNFMVYAIAEERGIAMPSFFAYLMWASLVLAVPFGIVTLMIGAR